MAGLNFQTAHVRLPAVSGNWVRRVCFRGKETRGKCRTLADLNFLAPQASGLRPRESPRGPRCSLLSFRMLTSNV